MISGLPKKKRIRGFGKFDQKDNRGPPLPPDFCKNYFFHLGWTYRKLVRGPIGNRFVDLSETGSWTYRKLVCGPIGNRFMDLPETGSWTYRKPVSGPIGNRLVDLSETSSWTYRKPVRGPKGNRFVPGAKRFS